MLRLRWAGAEYTDAGATAADIVDGDLTDSISVDNPVDTSMPGVYTVTYSVSDALENKSTITRKVTVGDTAAPVITLLGDAEITLEAGTEYTDAGATASDTLDGDLTDNIIVVNPVKHRNLHSHHL